jgi:hypothetical protein
VAERVLDYNEAGAIVERVRGESVRGECVRGECGRAALATPASTTRSGSASMTCLSLLPLSPRTRITWRSRSASDTFRLVASDTLVLDTHRSQDRAVAEVFRRFEQSPDPFSAQDGRGCIAADAEIVEHPL